MCSSKFYTYNWHQVPIAHFIAFLFQSGLHNRAINKPEDKECT